MAQHTYWETYAGSPPQNYERYLVPTMFGPWATDLLDLARPRVGERVLDVACGTGAVARQAAQRVGSGGKTVGLDLNPSMLEVARTASQLGIEWQQGSAEALPFPDQSFDLVLCQQALQFFHDRLTALREMRRVLVPGGRLALLVNGRIEESPPLLALHEILERRLSPAAAAFLDAVFSLRTPDELTDLIMGAGFDGVTIKIASKTMLVAPPGEFLWQYVGSTPLASLTAQLDDASRLALADEFASRCERYVNDDGLALLVELQLATAWR
jgi:SAM-dependent methyltransferase